MRDPLKGCLGRPLGRFAFSLIGLKRSHIYEYFSICQSGSFQK